MNFKHFFKVFLFLLGSFLIVILFLYGLLVGGIYWGINHIPINEFAHFEKDQWGRDEKLDPPKVTGEVEKKSESQSPPQQDKEKLNVERFRILFLENDEISKKTSASEMPSICELICQESFSNRHGINIKKENFYKYFKDYPEEFIHDPTSRLLLNILSNYRKIFTSEMFDIYNQIEKIQENGNSEFDKINLSNSIVLNILFYAHKLSSDYDLILKEVKLNNKLIKLNNSCEDKSLSEIKSECESIINQK